MDKFNVKLVYMNRHVIVKDSQKNKHGNCNVADSGLAKHFHR